MKPVFADTYYLIALFNPADKAHSAALEWARNARGMMVTSEWIITEFADAMSDLRNRERAGIFVEDLYRNTDVVIVRSSSKLLKRGLSLYRGRRDKTWSLTDCISIVIMHERKLTDALTDDRHFGQAGFRALMKHGL